MADMHPLLETMLDNMHSLATGDYLDDTSHWEPPYPPESVESMRRILSADIRSEHDLDNVLEKLQALNEEYDGALLEDEEREDLYAYLDTLGAEFRSYAEEFFEE